MNKKGQKEREEEKKKRKGRYSRRKLEKDAVHENVVDVAADRVDY